MLTHLLIRTLEKYISDLFFDSYMRASLTTENKNYNNNFMFYLNVTFVHE